jgi:hypothetical protein
MSMTSGKKKVVAAITLEPPSAGNREGEKRMLVHV